MKTLKEFLNEVSGSFHALVISKSGVAAVNLKSRDLESAIKEAPKGSYVARESTPKDIIYDLTGKRISQADFDKKAN